MNFGSLKCTCFADPFDNSKLGKVNKCCQCDYSSDRMVLWGLLWNHIVEKNQNPCNWWDYRSQEESFETHTGETPNKCNQWKYSSSWANNSRGHLKIHSRKSYAFALNVIIHPQKKAGWWRKMSHAFENTVGKVKQMQPVWLCILLGK